MKIKALLLFVSAALFFGSCKNEKKSTEEPTDGAQHETVETTVESKIITVFLEPRSGTETKGRVQFTEENGVVTIHAEIENLSPGTHAIHLHEKSDCSAEDGTSTGGHWNPTFEKHGKWGDAEGYHRGDIGNFEVGENGVGQVHFETDEWCIGCGDETKDIIGKAVIVHEKADDYITQPTGDAGGRVSCGGVIE